MRDRSPMTGDHHSLPVFNGSKQFGETSLSFSCLHFIHFYNQLF